MAAVTKSLSFCITASTTYESPFMLARRFATLDHLTNGRVVSADAGAVGLIEPAPFEIFKCSVLVYTASSDTAITFGLQRANAGDPQAAFEITEAFLENRTAPSSVMPTTGAIASRAPDAYTLALDPSWVNSPEMTLLVEA